ncbi:MAG TPA: R3H domain-containing nucleic acid-binding protein, partial [bacterium]
MEDTSHRRRGRRPGGHRGRDRDRDRDHDGSHEEHDGVDRVQAAREFTLEMESRLNLFVESEERELALEPMNSFKRRIVH